MKHDWRESVDNYCVTKTSRSSEVKETGVRARLTYDCIYLNELKPFYIEIIPTVLSHLSITCFHF